MSQATAEETAVIRSPKGASKMAVKVLAPLSELTLRSSPTAGRETAKLDSRSTVGMLRAAILWVGFMAGECGGGLGALQRHGPAARSRRSARSSPSGRTTRRPV